MGGLVMKRHPRNSMMRSLSTLGAGLIVLIACSNQGPDTGRSGTAPTTAAGRGAISIGLSLSTMDNPFFVALRDGAQAEAKAAGINLITVDAQNDAAKQIAGVEDLIQKKVPVLLLNPTDSDAVGNGVELEGIPGSSAARERGQGFDSAIADKPGVKLVAKQSASFDRAQGLTV